MRLKSILISGFVAKTVAVTGVLVFGLVSCRKKIDHELGVQEFITDQSTSGGGSGGGGGGGTSYTWAQITSAEIVNVMALQEFNGELYVGGLFENTAGDIQGFAKLDASDNLIHSGTSGFFGSWGVYDLHVYNNELIIGGGFTYYASGPNPEDLVRMNSSAVITDIPFSESLGHSVRNIMEYNAGLLITGDFEMTATNWVTTTNVEMLSNYSAVGMADLTETIYGSAEHQGELYVCGPDEKLKVWLGSSWDDVAYVGLYWSDEVWDVISYNSELYIMGQFNNGITLKRMTSGGTWENVDEVAQLGGMSFYGGMKVIDNELYLFEGSLTVNGGAASGIIKYNGTSWGALGNFSYEAHDVAKLNGHLYIASDYGVFKSE